MRKTARDRIASIDWNEHALGPQASWSPALRTSLDIILALPGAAYLVWGVDRTFFFNDAYVPILGPRLPHAMGARLEELWSDAWPSVEGDFARAMAGESVSHADRFVPMARHGKPEETWWTFSFSPVRDDDGAIAGVFCLTSEVTDAVRTKAAAELDRRRLRVAIDLAQLGMYTWNLASGDVTMDARSRDIWGFAPAEALDQQVVFDRIDPAKLGRIQEEVSASIEARRPLSIEYPILRPDGSRRIVRSGGDLIVGHEGELTQMVGTFADVTIERAGQEALVQANEALSGQLAERNAARERTWQFTPDLLSIIDLATGTFERLNPAWTTALGWSVSEMEGQTYADFVHPDDLAASDTAFRSVQRGEPVFRFENRYRTKIGNWRRMSWVAFPQGNKLYSSIRDVTEAHEQAAALAERTQERDRLWRNTQDLQVVIDQGGVFQAVNPAFTAILGWTPEDVIGKPVVDFVLPADEALTSNALRHARSRTLPTTENRYRHKNGGFRWIAWVATPEANLIYASGRHITAEKEQAQALETIAETLRQSQKMEAVGQLTGGLAHDFNNLLAGISGSLELMQTRMQQGRLNDVERYMGAAQGAAKRAAALTHRLLAFSRRQTLDPKPTDVTRLAMGMQEMIQRTVGPAILVEVVGATGVWPALVDPSQLENALLNLCINARDAMPDGGHITIETANKWMDERAASQHDMPEGQYLSLAVTDSGTGMPPEVVTRVFEPFFTTKPIGMGTGLGLSMIYGFAQQSGGQVRIYSEVGQGTTVAIYLPRHYGAAEEEKAIEKAIHLPRSREGETVLIVDDEPTVRMLVTDILDDLGYAAIEAGDSATGLKVLQSDVRIDLLVTDVGLPGGMNGRQMADAARQARPDLKVLFITGYAENAILNSGHLGPGMAILTKPFPMETMAARIRSMIEGRKAQTRPL